MRIEELKWQVYGNSMRFCVHSLMYRKKRLTESDKYYHLYDDESCGNLCFPVSIVEKENGKCILFSSVTDGDFGLRFGQMRIVPESQYK